MTVKSRLVDLRWGSKTAGGTDHGVQRPIQDQVWVVGLVNQVFDSSWDGGNEMTRKVTTAGGKTYSPVLPRDPYVRHLVAWHLDVVKTLANLARWQER